MEGGMERAGARARRAKRRRCKARRDVDEGEGEGEYEDEHEHEEDEEEEESLSAKRRVRRRPLNARSAEERERTGVDGVLQSRVGGDHSGVLYTAAAGAAAAAAAAAAGAAEKARDRRGLCNEQALHRDDAGLGRTGVRDGRVGRA